MNYEIVTAMHHPENKRGNERKMPHVIPLKLLSCFAILAHANASQDSLSNAHETCVVIIIRRSLPLALSLRRSVFDLGMSHVSE